MENTLVKHYDTVTNIEALTIFKRAHYIRPDKTDRAWYEFKDIEAENIKDIVSCMPPYFFRAITIVYTYPGYEVQVIFHVRKEAADTLGEGDLEIILGQLSCDSGWVSEGGVTDPVIFYSEQF